MAGWGRSENRAVMMLMFWPSLHACLSPSVGGCRICHTHFSDEKTEAEERLRDLLTLKAGTGTWSNSRACHCASPLSGGMTWGQETSGHHCYPLCDLRQALSALLSVCFLICNNGPLVLPLGGLNEISQVIVATQPHALHIVDAQ